MSAGVTSIPISIQYSWISPVTQIPQCQVRGQVWSYDSGPAGLLELGLLKMVVDIIGKH